MAELDSENGVLVFRSRYDRELVAALKSSIPPADRRWDPDRKVWLVTPEHGPMLAQLVEDYLDETIDLPEDDGAAPIRETRVLEVCYLGAARRRDDGSCTASGWVNGDWNAIFPEAVLRRWFGVDQDVDVGAQTLYNALGVATDAPGADIRKAYRRLARQWHPDVCHEPDAHERFLAIQRAYDVLHDPPMRAKYDAGLALMAAQAPTVGRRGYLDFADQTYRAPLRCGMVLATGTESLGRFVVEQVLAWEDIVDGRGRVLISSWPVGADTFEEEWQAI